MDAIAIKFDANSLILLNVIIAVMMFGVSLTLRVDDFRRIIRNPKAPIVGLIAQFILLPLFTCLATWAFHIRADLALGMILVAACPGGTFSNIMTWLAKGNVAVSISMTAVSSMAATILTPLNFTFYAHLNPYTRELLQEQIAVSSSNILLLILLVLGLPIVLGMLVGSKFPRIAEITEKPLRAISLVIFMLFIVLAFGNNMDIFVAYFGTFFWLVVLHNLGALLIGRGFAGLLRLPQTDTRAVTLEVGIQNSALGLIILFNFMPDAGGTMLITAFWGVWHLVSGTILAQSWAKIPITDGSEPAHQQLSQS